MKTTEKKEVKTIDLSKIPAKTIDGEIQEVSIQRVIAVAMYNTPDPGQGEFAMKVNRDPIVELTDENKSYLRCGLEQGQFYFFIKEAVENLLK